SIGYFTGLCLTLRQQLPRICGCSSILSVRPARGCRLGAAGLPAAGSAHFGDGVDQLFGVVPAQAGVGDGLAVDVFPDGLAAGFQVAFHHDALDQGADLGGKLAVVHDFLDNADLLVVLLVRVGVVGVHDDRRVLQVHLVVQLQQPHDVLIVIVGLGDTPLVDPAAQDRMGQRVAAGFHLAAGVGVVLGVLG